jgi:ABC-2 type transport system ATP-binding protein
MEEAEALCHAVAFVHRGRIVKSGSPAALKAEAGAGATLDDVFVHVTGGSLEEGGSYSEAVQTRQAVQRHG